MICQGTWTNSLKKNYDNEIGQIGTKAEMKIKSYLENNPTSVEWFGAIEHVKHFTADDGLDQQVKGRDFRILSDIGTLYFDNKDDRNVGVSGNLLIEFGQTWKNGFWSPGWMYHTEADFITYTNIDKLPGVLYVVRFPELFALAQDFLADPKKYGKKIFIHTKFGKYCKNEGQDMTNIIINEALCKNFMKIYKMGE